MSRGPLASIVPFTKKFFGAHFSFYHQHGWHVEGVTIIEYSSGTRQRDPPKKSFIYFGPLLNFLKNHHADP